MKKGLLLSVVASTVIFAGGDIAPVEPAAAAPAADCSDFYGAVGAYYQTVKDAAAPGKADDMFAKGNSRFDVTATIGVEKTIFGGIGFGAEVSGWSSVGSRIALTHRVNGAAVLPANYEDGSLSQLFLTASFGNTAVKAGRFAIPGSLSPLLRTGTTAGVKNNTFDGILVANTDLADTTVYGVWAYAVHTAGVSKDTKLGKPGDETGAFALGLQNKSLANTTITAVGYYGPDLMAVGSDTMAGALTVNSKFGAYGVDAQVTYVDGDIAGLDATMTAALKVSGSFDMFDAWVMAAYINDGDFASTLAGGEGSLLGDAIDTTTALIGTSRYGIGGGVSAKVWTGSAYLTAGYRADDDAVDTARTFVTVGYKFKAAGVAFKAEYKYANVTKTGAADVDNSRVRLEAVYNF